MGVEPKIWEHLFIGFSLIFTIHFGVPLFLETAIYNQIVWFLFSTSPISTPAISSLAPDMFVHDFASPCTFSPKVNDLHSAVAEWSGLVAW